MKALRKMVAHAVALAALASTAAFAASPNLLGPGNLGNAGGGRPIPTRPIPTRPVPALPLVQQGGTGASVPGIDRRAADSGTVKQPYTYRYYDDTDRGDKGCYWMAQRAIGTHNKNWWNRYRACKDVQ